jgi:hypothetical protein
MSRIVLDEKLKTFDCLKWELKMHEKLDRYLNFVGFFKINCNETLFQTKRSHVENLVGSMVTRLDALPVFFVDYNESHLRRVLENVSLVDTAALVHGTLDCLITTSENIQFYETAVKPGHLVVAIEKGFNWDSIQKLIFLRKHKEIYVSPGISLQDGVQLSKDDLIFWWFKDLD